MPTSLVDTFDVARELHDARDRASYLWNQRAEVRNEIGGDSYEYKLAVKAYEAAASVVAAIIEAQEHR